MQGELDELEREEFFRLKKVQKKKKKDEELRLDAKAAKVRCFSQRRLMHMWRHFVAEVHEIVLGWRCCPAACDTARCCS